MFFKSINPKEKVKIEINLDLEEIGFLLAALYLCKQNGDSVRSSSSESFLTRRKINKLLDELFDLAKDRCSLPQREVFYRNLDKLMQGKNISDWK